MSEEDVQNTLPDWQRVVRAALEGMPQDYKEFYERASEMRHEFMRELAHAMEMRLNRHVAEQPQHSIEDKRSLTSAINHDLRQMQLCLQCPTTGQPAILASGYRDNEERDSRFRFAIQEPGRTSYKGVFHTIPPLKVIEAPPRVESLARRRGGQ